jgi:DNA-binding IclR family transcriptional regulator
VQEFAIPKSSLFNLLATLVDREYLQFVNQDRSRYQLGPRIVELAQIMRRPESMIERTRPLLKHLSNSPKETSGMSLLLVEHDMEFVIELVDRIVVLDFGKKVAQGVPYEIRNNPIVQEAYLGAVM